MNRSLSLRDALLAATIMAVWGTNFVIIRAGLTVLPPLLFAALRFTFALFPLALFLPRPKASWRNLAAYGFCTGVGQFGLLFIAMDGMISPGLASLVAQMQVFFTVLLSMLRNGEKLMPHQLAGFVLAIAGMGLIMAHNGQGATITGVVLTLGAAASWALANQTAKESGVSNIFAYIVWSSLFAAVPLFVLAWLVEGLPAIRAGFAQAGPAAWAAVLWQSVGNTMFGYGCWAWLLSRYSAATIAPTSLLVPVFGFAASSLWMGEPLQGWKIAATALVMAGLAINLLWRAKPATLQTGA